MAIKRKHQNQTSRNDQHNNASHGNSKHRFGRRHEMVTETHKKPHFTLYNVLVVVLALVTAILHRNHVATLFENEKRFSYLSSLERELSFRTEMGLYYSYYKTMIESPTFYKGLEQVMHDNVTEYPLTINTLKRFNLYPEVVVAIGYRTYMSMNAYFGRVTKQCFNINRGEGMSSVESCIGLGEPSYFYVETVLILTGLMMGVIFLISTMISGSIFGGILTVACYFFNHGECTRVMWTIPLRESFAFPILMIQMFIVTITLRCSTPNWKHSVAIALPSVAFMLSWQFGQFTLLTQTMAVFATYVLMYINAQKFQVILHGLVISFIMSYLALFGNEMLLTSFFFSCLVTVLVIVYSESYIERLKVRFVIWMAQGSMLILGTIGIKMWVSKLLQVQDDAHIRDIFLSKFSNFQNFHTMLYTCAKEFDFQSIETYKKLTWTLLLPSGIVACVAAVIYLLRTEYKSWKETRLGEGDIQKKQQKHGEIVYHLFQLLAFTAMSIVIMRLKLFWTPHMCLITSLLASKQFFGWLGGKERHFAVLAVLVAMMTYEGYQNLQKQWKVMGEYSNYPLEEMLEWIGKHTHKDAVFAGPMPTMATLKLCANRPIVNHPHYEDAGLRERTMKVYSMYSRKPPKVVYDTYMALGVDYAVLENSWCIKRSRPGCGMAEIWDLEDVENRQREKVCNLLKEDPAPHFRRVFRNKIYDILQLVK
ncbi:hypothetical protein ScPMuIL_016177 [Solemya velum]